MMFVLYPAHNMTMHDDAIENNLLAAISHKEYQRLLAWLEPVTLSLGEHLQKPGEKIRYVYFPGTALVSLLAQADGHLAVEVGLIGREGMVGVPLLLGNNISSVGAMVQVPGTAMRIAAEPFRKEFSHSLPLQRALYGYTNTLMSQISQTSACNRFHLLEQRLARWLLMTQDRVMSNHFRMTHEFLGHVLGVRRVGITKAAQTLQMRKLISYSRGDITVLNRKGLEAAACQCYETITAIDKGTKTPARSREPELSVLA